MRELKSFLRRFGRLPSVLRVSRSPLKTQWTDPLRRALRFPSPYGIRAPTLTTGYGRVPQVWLGGVAKKSSGNVCSVTFLLFFPLPHKRLGKASRSRGKKRCSDRCTHYTETVRASIQEPSTSSTILPPPPPPFAPQRVTLPLLPRSQQPPPPEGEVFPPTPLQRGTKGSFFVLRFFCVFLRQTFQRRVGNEQFGH